MQEPLDLVTSIGSEAPEAVEVADRVHTLIGYACKCVKLAHKWQRDYYKKKHWPLESIVNRKCYCRPTTYICLEDGSSGYVGLVPFVWQLAWGR